MRATTSRWSEGPASSARTDSTRPVVRQSSIIRAPSPNVAGLCARAAGPPRRGEQVAERRLGPSVVLAVVGERVDVPVAAHVHVEAEEAQPVGMVAEASQRPPGHGQPGARLAVDPVGCLQRRRQVHRGEGVPAAVPDVAEQHHRRDPPRRRAAADGAPPGVGEQQGVGVEQLEPGGRPHQRVVVLALGPVRVVAADPVEGLAAGGRASPAAPARRGRGAPAHTSAIAARATGAGTPFATFQVPTSRMLTRPPSPTGGRRGPRSRAA